jgi:hypothetical protein
MRLWLSAIIIALSPVMGLGQSFVESFETGLPDPTGTLPNHGPPGASLALATGTWFAFNNSSPLGTTGVFFQNGTSGPFAADPSAGTNYAAMNFNSGAGTANISTFLMSPNLTFNNGDTISFITRTVTTVAFPDRLRLLLSTNGASTTPADFSTVLLSVNEGLTLAGYPNTWTSFNATISGLGGPTSGRFAFNYNVPNAGPSGANSDFIGIDTAAYTIVAVPEPTTWALMGLSTAGLGGVLFRVNARRRRLADLPLKAGR